MSDRKKTYSIWFVAIVALFITCLITSNIIAVKLIEVFGFVVTAAIVIFPISYICGDVLTEVYGYRATKRVIWLGFFCNLLAVAAIAIAQGLPGASFWDGQGAYNRILGYTPRLLLASFLAYLIGEFTNAIVLAKLKVITGGRYLWMRTIGSTLVGQGLDSVVFVTIAFLGTIPFPGMGEAIVVQWLFKSTYEILATPLTYWVVAFLKDRERLDVYDRDLAVNPFKLEEDS
ncbi:queuosine precursor transporter [Oxynema aestuarii]|jgi:uncharacterized integral membrane protein (TIGR00697 family)|uniref:Probable queuosine precursor transporter n=1 Tax=Oxynema aestuarii AP17 TaxID=2064643 RepID=A0A6H1TYU9_9CYAN|nr:queuosine precursor transporter [Oxynema aestuarii]QIZ70539.1 queuosine precursor transporter [Oxynema aestuarii AP17]RMH72592.1 MAG: VUT family protein [Cyanobacteria bacterium J007]